MGLLPSLFDPTGQQQQQQQEGNNGAQ